MKFRLINLFIITFLYKYYKYYYSIYNDIDVQIQRILHKKELQHKLNEKIIYHQPNIDVFTALLKVQLLTNKFKFFIDTLNTIGIFLGYGPVGIYTFINKEQIFDMIISDKFLNDFRYAQVRSISEIRDNEHIDTINDLIIYDAVDIIHELKIV